MPIQIAPNTFRAFKYNPDYLQDKKGYISDGKMVFPKAIAAINPGNYELDLMETSLVLDDGNVTEVEAVEQLRALYPDCRVEQV